MFRIKINERCNYKSYVIIIESFEDFIETLFLTNIIINKINMSKLLDSNLSTSLENL